MNRMLRRFAAALVAALAIPAAHAADWPTRPLRWVVPFPAGGPTDGVTRTVAQHVSATLGQPVVIENKPGADGAIAAQTVATAAPDGTTFLVGTSAVMALPVLSRNAGFAVQDLAPVASFGWFGFGLYVNPEVPARSVQELVAFARANPGKLNYAAANFSEHIAAAQFARLASVDMVRVPYKGAAQAIPDLLANRVQVYFTPLVAGLQQSKEGRLRLLATLQPTRSPLAPDVPTIAEAGVPGVGVQTRQMLLAPAGTPQAIVTRLAGAVGAALADPGVRSQLEQRALVVDPATPQRVASIIAEANREWARFAQETGAGQ